MKIRLNKATRETGVDDSPDENSFFRWVIQLDVHETWIQDGFNLDTIECPEDLVQALSSLLQYTYEHEVSAKILKSPPKTEIKIARGGPIPGDE